MIQRFSLSRQEKLGKLLARFWDDERGAVSALSVIFVTVILAIGVLAGLVVVRDHVVQEFGDVSVGLDSLDQSFSYEIVVDGEVCVSVDHNDDSATLTDPVDTAPADLDLGVDPSGENGTRPTPSGGFP